MFLTSKAASSVGTNLCDQRQSIFLIETYWWFAYDVIKNMVM